MTRLDPYPTYDDWFEYFGGTMVKQTRKKADETVWQDWLIFDSVEAAFEFFNEFSAPTVSGDAFMHTPLPE